MLSIKCPMICTIDEMSTDTIYWCSIVISVLDSEGCLDIPETLIWFDLWNVQLFCLWIVQWYYLWNVQWYYLWDVLFMKRGHINNLKKYILIFFIYFHKPLQWHSLFSLSRATFTGFGSTGFRFKRDHPDIRDDFERLDFS